MPSDLSLAHGIAVLLLFLAWGLYTPLLSVLRGGTLNQRLEVVRRRWIGLSMVRDNRTYDAVMIGHLINSVAFFGSATLIVLVGLLGTLANVRGVHAIVTQLPFVKDSSMELLAFDLAVVTLILAIGFFSFTYALRKMIYMVALAGGLPEAAEDGAAGAMRNATATVLTEAVRSFNSGIRSYYIAVAALFLFIGPLVCMVMTVLTLALLVYRQIGTRTARAIEGYVEALARMEE